MGKKKKNGAKKQNGSLISSPELKFHPEAECASKIIRSHASVGSKVEPPQPSGDGGFRIKFNMSVSLPSRANRRGISETGVRSQEPVTFYFPRTYPFHAPAILLRSDFNKSLPHIIPIYNREQKDYVLPCVYDGPLEDLLHQEGDGLSEILNQLSEWLGKAAIGDLIDSKQGWEPIRRDNTLGWMVYDLSKLRTLVQAKEGTFVFQCRYLEGADSRGKSYFVWVIDDVGPCKITPALIRNSFFAEKGPYGTTYGSLAILAWSNSEAIIDCYLPESVQDLHQLYERAKDYHTFDALRSAILDFGWAFKQASMNISSFPLFIMLCARRPHALIRDDSSLELIPYLVDCHIEESTLPFPESGIRVREDSPVLPLGHRHKVSRRLLQRMSGGKEAINAGHIVHIGCGSVGSKIAMHLARAGHGPFKLIDKETFSPHNVARHALTPITEFPGQPKASLLAREIELLRLEAEAINEDIINLCKNPVKKMDPFADSSRLVIESTGSVAVRDMLASLPDGKLHGRLLHVALYQQGKFGVMAIEGSLRNPNVNDLIIRLWNEMIDDPGLRSKFLLFPGEMSREEIGLGCGSHTMVMPDTRISLFASGMAERARQILELENGTLHDGELWIGRLDENKIGVSWKLYKPGRTTILRVKVQNPWEVRILSEAANLIAEEAKAWREIETGGVLIGRISLSNRCFIISRVLEAPPDSIRSENVFVLGVEGLKKKVQEIYGKSAGTLTYVGAWHSHPKGGEASSIDNDSLDQIRRLRFGAPAVGLIWTPSGFRVGIDEGKLA